MKLLVLIGALFFAQLGLAAEFQLTSPTLKNNGTLPEESVFNGMGCKGGNISPELHWSHAPAGTKSFAVTVYDPDAPTGSGWWHWTVANIPAKVDKLAKGASGSSKMPAGSVEGRTDFGRPGYGGACPPAGDKPHHYIFTVIALKTDKLDLNSDAGGAMYGFMTNANALGKATLTVTYGRK